LNKAPPEQRPVTVRDFAARKRKGEKLVVMTAYDALFGRLVDESGVDAILVGDSLGTAIMGYTSTLPVTLDHMIYHASAVRRGVKRALVIIDMPFLSYQASIESAVLNCGRAIQESGAGAVKVEGGSPEMLDTVHALVRTGIPVMAHIGFTPQSVNTLGGARVQGREEEGAERLIAEAKGLEDAGAFGIVLCSHYRGDWHPDNRDWRWRELRWPSAGPARCAWVERHVPAEISETLCGDGGRSPVGAWKLGTGRSQRRIPRRRS
jgi:hypothetical protein